MRTVSGPNFSLEDGLLGPVCGIDEAGRGPLAGPVVAACVHIPKDVRVFEFIKYINDSKKLTDKKREFLFEEITKHCSYGIAHCTPYEIDEMNILQASLTAMERAYRLMPQKAEHALIDGNKIPKNLPCVSTPVVKGDARSVSIAAASILAKVTRDRIMRTLAQDHPHYGWDRNAGYPTAEHRTALALHGPTEHHRRSFGPVNAAIKLQAVR
ncbi:MAG: ribonuclease HII [Alphaproteobacteria bacterium]